MWQIVTATAMSGPATDRTICALCNAAPHFVQGDELFSKLARGQSWIVTLIMILPQSATYRHLQP